MAPGDPTYYSVFCIHMRDIHTHTHVCIGKHSYTYKRSNFFKILKIMLKFCLIFFFSLSLFSFSRQCLIYPRLASNSLWSGRLEKLLVLLHLCSVGILSQPIDELLWIEPRALVMLSKYSTNSANPKSISLSFGILKVCCEGHTISVLRKQKVSATGVHTSDYGFIHSQQLMLLVPALLLAQHPCPLHKDMREKWCYVLSVAWVRATTLDLSDLTV